MIIQLLAMAFILAFGAIVTRLIAAVASLARRPRK